MNARGVENNRSSAARDLRIKALAYHHRYGWIVVLFFALMFCKNRLSFGFVTGGVMIVHAAHTLLGYVFRWKHIYCSYQNAYHKKMTPDIVCWADIRKSAVYGVPAFFFVLGVAITVITVFCI